jgi:dihydrofolate reductase
MFDLIVAMNPKGLIGVNNELPWRVPEDLAYFREKTMGKTIIMGRKTFTSFPNQAPLPGRTNLVLTRDTNLHDYVNNDCGDIIAEKYVKMEDVLALEEHAFIIGGGEIFRDFLHKCNKLYVTLVYKDAPEKDDDDLHIYFPCTIWQLISDYKIEYESEIYESKNKGTKYKFYVFCGKNE